MSGSLPDGRRSVPVPSLDGIRPRVAKADLRTSDDRTFAVVVTEAVLKHYGSVKAAALSLGEVDPSLMQREFAAGNFKRLALCDPSAKAAIGKALGEAYPSTDPLLQCARLVRDLRRCLDELGDWLLQVSA